MRLQKTIPVAGSIIQIRRDRNGIRQSRLALDLSLCFAKSAPAPVLNCVRMGWSKHQRVDPRCQSATFQPVELCPRMTSPFVESKTEAEAFASGWGAVSIGDQVRFRLWAPGQERLSLRLGGTDIPMARDNEGWFSLVQPCVAAGTPYQFVLADGQAIADPASRAQRDGVDSPSLVTDPLSYRWRHADWRGRPWKEFDHL